MDVLSDFVEFSMTNAMNPKAKLLEDLKALQIDKINGLTTYIDLDKFDNVLHNKSQSKTQLLPFFIDQHMMNTLASEKVITGLQIWQNCIRCVQLEMEIV